MKSYTSSIIFSLIILFSISSCGTMKMRGRSDAYPNMYKQKTVSILIMPPINKTNRVEAKEAVYASLYRPLANKGYYIFSPVLSQELLQSESADDAEMFIDGSLEPFHEVITADAVLFTIIHKWQKIDLLSRIDVDIEYILKTTIGSNTLFKKRAILSVDCSTVSTQNALLDLIANTLVTALTDNVIGAYRANQFVIADLPAGIYSPDYGKDGKISVNDDEIHAHVKAN